MGFDLYAENPTALKAQKNVREKIKTGKVTREDYDQMFNDASYFRRNVWGWRRLWDFAGIIGFSILTTRDFNMGCNNNGHLINAKKAKALGEHLLKAYKDGRAKAFEKQVKSEIAEAKKNNKAWEKKKLTMNSKPSFEDEFTHKDHRDSYYFEAKDAKEFGEFCLNSGGFRIC